MFFLFLLLIAATLFFLVRTGRIGPPPWASRGSPEAEAKRVLAERFARGDITTDEFMEKASVLNWTPGTDPYENWQAGQEGQLTAAASGPGRPPSVAGPIRVRGAQPGCFG